MNGARAQGTHPGATAPPPVGAEYDDPRVIDAVERYVTAVEAGEVIDRSRYVAQHPEIATALRECLEGLNFMRTAAPSFPGVAISMPAAEEVAAKTPLGDYQILREIGRGGMGIVYEAEQLSLGRRVALKVLPFAAALNEKHLQRFKNEALAAAHLQHPHIVPVYAVGCERGVNYYTMRFINGQSLAALIRSLRPENFGTELTPLPGQASRGAKSSGAETAVSAPSGSPAPISSPVGSARESRSDRSTSATFVTDYSRAHVRFFRHVARLGWASADALEHAHQMGVIHRDIKPSNLLLDGEGHLWVTDFGLALLPNHAGVTMTGEVVGTARYMSPEQASVKHGLVDHRTDIYSLGVTLYELLTLQPVFAGQDRHELLHAVLHDEPVPPRRHDARIPRELETIVLKAMSKNPSDRYATAQEFSDDLQRFLDDQPIRARRPGVLEKAVKWSRRHRGLVASALCIMLVALVGLSATTILVASAYEKERQSAEKERQSAEEARRQHDRAEANYRQASRAVELFARFSEEELANNPAMLGVRRRLLETTLDYYQDFLDKHRDDLSIPAEIAACQARVSRILTELSMLQGPTLLSILKDRKVQQDLKLDDDQKEQVIELADEFSKEWGKGFTEYKKLNPEERRQKALESARATEESLEDVLSPEQIRRFKQIALQVQQHGRYGFSNPELLEALTVTTKQREKIRKIQNDTFMSIWAAAGPKYPKAPKPAEVWAKAYEQILEVLTPPQRDKWRELAGPPVKVEIHTVYLGEGLELRSPALEYPPPLDRPPGGFGGKKFGPGKGKPKAK